MEKTEAQVSEIHHEHSSAMTSFLNSVYIAATTYVTSMIAYPLDTITTIIKSNATTLSSKEVIRLTYKNNGIHSFFNGIDILPAESIPPVITYYFAYDFLFQRLKNRFEMGWLAGGVSAIVAEVFSLVVQLPPDIVRIRMQAGRHSDKSWWQIVKDIYRNEGILRFYSVGSLYIAISFIYTVSMFTIYEGVRDYFDVKNFSLYPSLLGSVLATFGAVALTNPLDNIFIPYQLTDFSVSKNESMYSLFKEYVYRHGYAGLTKGFKVRFLTHFLHVVFMLPMYDFLRSEGFEGH